MATVFDNSEPVSIIRKQRGMISVERRKWITALLSFCCSKKISHVIVHGYKELTLTRAPMTPREVSLKYSNGRVLEVVLRKG